MKWLCEENCKYLDINMLVVWIMKNKGYVLFLVNFFFIFKDF